MVEVSPIRTSSPRILNQNSSTLADTNHVNNKGQENDGDLPGDNKLPPARWNMGMLNDKETIEVPGSVLLLAKDHNTPLGLRNAPARTSHSSLPVGLMSDYPTKKMTPDGIILVPQPEDSANDPLNWPTWRRDLALVSLGFYCMLGGGVSPLLAAGFTNIAADYGVPVERVALTAGFAMMGQGIGSVFASPTAILYGKRPIYLVSVVLFIASSVWCALSPNFTSLVIARIVQGIAVSPVECLPSATIAEIFFLHERAYRLGIYTLLLLGGKNLIPVASAAIISAKDWRWVFWILVCVTAFGGILIFIFVPETFWDRTPVPKSKKPPRPALISRLSSQHNTRPKVNRSQSQLRAVPQPSAAADSVMVHNNPTMPNTGNSLGVFEPSPGNSDVQRAAAHSQEPMTESVTAHAHDPEKADASEPLPDVKSIYTHKLRHMPAQSWSRQLRPWNGRLNPDSWFKALIRPFILYAYPSVLWSSAVYACSVGWLIVISETMAIIYRGNEFKYHFTALQTGFVYFSPFIGGILGTAVAGKVSDFVVGVLVRRNGGLYEPEFRLVMIIPVAITTVMGLMGFGWSSQVGNHWMVPTFFFGLTSFGCSLGSTTSITFCVDSYRQYAGEALVTLNFLKNIGHGLVFSLFVSHWMHGRGPKEVFMWIGIIQLIVLLFSIPMYVFGKRCRMWTVRKNFMEKF